MHRVDTAGATLDNKFTDGDPAQAVPATVVDAAILNGIQEEIVNCIVQMGIALEKGNNTQLWEAIASLLATHANLTNPHGATAAAIADRMILRGADGRANVESPLQFDNSTLLATTAFVQQAVGNYSGYATLNTNRVMTAADIGKIFGIDAPALTMTLPVTAGLKVGSALTFITQNPFTVSSPDGKSIMLSIGTGTTIVARGSLSLVWRGDIWQQVALTATNFSTNGYKVDPNTGEIEQWGYAVTPAANGIIDITFPVAFPNNCFNIEAIHEGGDGAMVTSVGGYRSLTGWRALVVGHGGNTSAGWAILWRAKGN